MPVKTPAPSPAIQHESAPAGTMGFYFCEKCGKRVTAADLARGQGRDKQLKGVHCAACADGTMTVAFDAVSQAEVWKEAEARRQGQRRSTSTRLPASKADGSAPRRGRSSLFPPGSRTKHARTVWAVLAAILFCGVGIFLAFGGGSRRASNSSMNTTRQPAAKSPAQQPSSQPASISDTTRKEESPPPAPKPSTRLVSQVEPEPQPVARPATQTTEPEPTAPVAQVPSPIPDTQTPETTKTVPVADRKPETVNDAISSTKMDLCAEADAYVRSGQEASSNFGKSPMLETKDGSHGEAYDRKAYIRFDLSSLPAVITSAKLRIYAINSKPGTRSVRLVPDDTWQETAITWQNAPSPAGSVLASWQPVAGQCVELDLTATVQQELAGDKKISLLIYATSAGGQKSGLEFASREAAAADQHPILIINK